MAAEIYKGGKIFLGSPLRAKVDIVASGAATVTIKPSQSGATFLFDAATGIIYTLPKPKKGLNYRFVVSVSVTSNNHKIVTDVTGTTLFYGSVWNTVAAGTGTQFFPNGSSHSALTMNGTTTGGLINTDITVTCLDSTHWQVDGTVMGSGTVATPFANS